MSKELEELRKSLKPVIEDLAYCVDFLSKKFNAFCDSSSEHQKSEQFQKEEKLIDIARRVSVKTLFTFPRVFIAATSLAPFTPIDEIEETLMKNYMATGSFKPREEVVEAPTKNSGRFMSNVKFKLLGNEENLISCISNEALKAGCKFFYTDCDGLEIIGTSSDGLYQFWKQEEVSVHEAIPGLIPDGMVYDKENVKFNADEPFVVDGVSYSAGLHYVLGGKIVNSNMTAITDDNFLPLVSKYEAVPGLVPEGMVYDKKSDSLVEKDFMLVSDGFDIFAYSMAGNILPTTKKKYITFFGEVEAVETSSKKLYLDEVAFINQQIKEDPEGLEAFMAKAASHTKPGFCEDAKAYADKVNAIGWTKTENGWSYIACDGTWFSTPVEAIAHNKKYYSKPINQKDRELILSLMSKYLFTYNQTEHVLKEFGERQVKRILELCQTNNINPLRLGVA